MVDKVKPDWSAKEMNEYFTFTTGMRSESPDVVYYGELITLLNPNIVRASIEEIPRHSNEKPHPSTEELGTLKKLLGVDSTLMANRFQIKKIEPRE